LAATITVFDGANCIGGNKIHLEFDGHGLFFDFGTNYGKLSEYYEEFLQPRSSRGLHDFLQMGLLPPLSCYRPDAVPSDIDLSQARKLPVDAVFISHAHMDHIGHAGFIDFDIPFVATPMSAAVMKAIKDCGQSGLESECVYGRTRRRSEADDRIISTPYMKKDEMYRGRDFVLTSPPSDRFKGFWEQSVYSHPIDAGDLLDASSLDFKFKAFEVDHSIYGACAYAVETSSGWVVYSGDLRAHGRFKDKTEEFVNAARSLHPAALVIEGTRTSREESGTNQSEEMVMKTCLEAAEAEKGMLIGDFSPRNFERLDTFLDIAERTDRTLMVTKKDAYYLRSIQSVDGEDRLGRMAVYGQLKVKESGAEGAACDTLDSELVDPRDLAGSPEKYLLAFSFYDLGNLLDIKIKGGMYIYSSSEAYNEEQIIDFRRLANWLSLFRLEVKGFAMVGDPGHEKPVFVTGYHASGHASTEDLRHIIERIDPDRVIPVHTEDVGPFSGIGSCEVIPPQAGRAISF
jgi:ribonuclease J